jgi:ketosteroid isomerase-like protein
MMEAAQIHRLVEDAFNAGDVDALVALYEEEAAMGAPDGTFVHGHAAIRDQWSGFIALGGTIQMRTRHAEVVDNVALLSNDWYFVADGMEFSSRTSEVARRQPDGTCKYLIDNPYAGADLSSE